MEEKILFWHMCRECGYMITDLSFFTARYNFDCPRCERTLLSEFGVIEVSV